MMKGGLTMLAGMMAAMSGGASTKKELLGGWNPDKDHSKFWDKHTRTVKRPFSSNELKLLSALHGKAKKIYVRELKMKYPLESVW